MLNIKNRKKKTIRVNKEIGFLAHVRKNIFILGLQGELRIVNLKTKKTIKSILVEKNLKLNRLNDGKTDPIGRLWFGTMDNLERNIEKGSLYCLDKNFKLKRIDTKYMITNGPAFIDVNNFYHTDSRKKTIYKIKVDKKLKISSKKIFKKFKKDEGSPDGMTLDKKHNLWTYYIKPKEFIHQLKNVGFTNIKWNISNETLIKYDDYIKYNGETFPRETIKGKDMILVEGKWKEAGDTGFPWEDDANNGNH